MCVCHRLQSSFYIWKIWHVYQEIVFVCINNMREGVETIVCFFSEDLKLQKNYTIAWLEFINIFMFFFNRKLAFVYIGCYSMLWLQFVSLTRQPLKILFRLVQINEWLSLLSESKGDEVAFSDFRSSGNNL